jgi:hypothetical protein
MYPHSDDTHRVDAQERQARGEGLQAGRRPWHVPPDQAQWQPALAAEYRFAGKEKLLALGGYPEVSLKRAREHRDAARQLLREGKDPAAERKAARRAVKLNTEKRLRTGCSRICTATEGTVVEGTCRRRSAPARDLHLP